MGTSACGVLPFAWYTTFGEELPDPDEPIGPEDWFEIRPDPMPDQIRVGAPVHHDNVWYEVRQ